MTKTTLTPAQQLNAMVALASEEFKNVFDKSGRPYIFHCFAVMMFLDSIDDELNAIAIGHDLIEDRGKTVTYSGLRDMGFSERVIEGIRSMTKQYGQTKEEYKAQVKANPDSIRVKIADLRHNSDITRLKDLTPKNIERTIFYHQFYTELKALV